MGHHVRWSRLLLTLTLGGSVSLALFAMANQASAQTGTGGNGGAASTAGSTGGSGGAGSPTGTGGAGNIPTAPASFGGGGGGGAGVNGGSGGNGQTGFSGGAGGVGPGASGGIGSSAVGGGAGGGGGGANGTGVIAGGKGGDGGDDFGLGTGGGGGGGQGGYGAVVNGAGLTFTNSGPITGGTGGNGGRGFNGSGGNGGDGGHGVFLTGGSTLVNSGIITGGNGGTRGGNTGAGTPGTPGVGGVGVIGSSTGAGITVINSGTISAGFANNGTGAQANAITFNGGTNLLQLQAGSTINGNVVAFSTADTLQLGGTTNSSFNLSQVGPAAQYQGFGLFDKTGSSTWTVTGTNAGPFLAASVSAGTLVVNGTLNSGTMAVNPGATLAGIGTVNGATTVNGGTVAPGPVGGVGTLTIVGAYNTSANGTLQVNTAGAASSLLQVTGAGNQATLGGTSHLVINGTGTAGSTYTILTMTAPRVGQFATVIDNVPSTTAIVLYDPFDVRVMLVFSGGGGGGLMGITQTFNQATVASALTAAAGNPAFTSVFSSIAGFSAPQARFTLDQLSGEVYGSALSAGIENQALWLRTLAQHVRLANTCLCPATGAGDASGCDGDGTWRSWATPFGMAGTNQGDNNAHAFAYQSVGLAAGSDRRVGDEGNGLVGFATGYSNWGNTTNFINSSAFSNSFNLASYARAQLGQAWVLGIASYEYDGYTSRRPMDLLGSVANANFSGNQLGSYVETGYAIPVGGMQVQPIGALQYISAWRNGVSENGAGALDLNVAGARADSFRSQLGSRVIYPITTGGGRCILPEVGGYWIHEYAADTRNDVNQFAGGGPVFLANGANLGRDFGLFSAGISTQAGPSMRLGVNYQSYVTPTAVAHGGMGQVQLAW